MNGMKRVPRNDQARDRVSLILAGLRIFLLTDFAQKCRERDGNRCILTNMPDPEVCHIFPHNMLSSNDPQKSHDITRFWQLLGIFWGEEQVETWKRRIFPFHDNPNTGIDAVFNLICLDSRAHRLWNEGAFALRPLDESDEYKLEVEFVWQTRYKLRSSSNVDLLKVPASSQGLYHSPVPSNSAAEKTLHWVDYNHPRFPTHTLVSGTRFTFTTTDPVNRPLPSKELLNMQWALQRVTAMAAAAEWKWIEGSYDDSMPDVGNMNTTNTTLEDIFKWIPPPQEERLTWRGPTYERGLPSVACV